MKIRKRASQQLKLKLIITPWYLKQDFQRHSSADQAGTLRSLRCPKHRNTQIMSFT
jgi:hypothetical protein